MYVVNLWIISLAIRILDPSGWVRQVRGEDNGWKEMIDSGSDYDEENEDNFNILLNEEERLRTYNQHISESEESAYIFVLKMF